MKTRIAIFLFFLSGWSCGTLRPQVPAEVPLAVTGVTGIDVRNGSRTANATILIEAGRVTAVGTARDTRVPSSARVVSARGKYVIPGLWDMHVHIQNQQELDIFFPLLVAHGILGIRDANGLLPREFRELGKRHEYVPHVVACGPAVDGPAPAGVADAAIVDELADKGVDHIKVFSMLPRERFLAIMAGAKQRGLRVAGHVPAAVGAADASDLGLQTMEHLLEIYLSSSNREVELRAAHVAKLARETSPANQILEIAWPPLEPLLSSWSDEKASALFKKLVANHTWQTPTLELFRVGRRLRQRAVVLERSSSWLHSKTLAGFMAPCSPQVSDRIPAIGATRPGHQNQCLASRSNKPCSTNARCTGWVFGGHRCQPVEFHGARRKPSR